MKCYLIPIVLGCLAFPAATVALSGCNSPPRAAEIAQAEIGPMPSSADTERLIRAWGQANLKDPDSARYTFGSLKRGYYQPNPTPGNGSLTAEKAQFGWEQVVSINAKNSYGGYTGQQVYQFYFRDGRLVYYVDVSGSLRQMGIR
jgi:hypothetical protein